MLWSSQSELVFESVQVAMQGELFSSYTMLKGYVRAARENKWPGVNRLDSKEVEFSLLENAMKIKLFNEINHFIQPL